MGTELRQRYSPDTCGCVLVQVFPDRDDSSSWHVPVHAVRDHDGNHVPSLKRCPAHEGLSHGQIERCIVKDVDSEQKRKNGLIGEIHKDLSIGLVEEVDSDDNVLEDHPQLGRIPKLDAVTGLAVKVKTPMFKPGVDVRHVFTGTGENRELEMWVVGAVVTPAMRVKLDQCAARCGSAARPIVIKAQAEIT